MRAVKWWRPAAEQNHADAQRALGDAFLWGEGVEKDIVLAYMWFSLATTKENERAKIGLDFVVKILMPDQRAQAIELAEAWRQAHGG